MILGENKTWTEMNNDTIVFYIISEIKFVHNEEFCNIEAVIEQNWINTELTGAE